MQPPRKKWEIGITWSCLTGLGFLGLFGRHLDVLIGGAWFLQTKHSLSNQRYYFFILKLVSPSSSLHSIQRELFYNSNVTSFNSAYATLQRGRWPHFPFLGEGWTLQHSCKCLIAHFSNLLLHTHPKRMLYLILIWYQLIDKVYTDKVSISWCWYTIKLVAYYLIFKVLKNVKYLKSSDSPPGISNTVPFPSKWRSRNNKLGEEKKNKAARQLPLLLIPLCELSLVLLQGPCKSVGVVFVQ